MTSKKKIKSFTDLIAWQEGHKLVLGIYEIIKKFPAKEKFGLSISRAAVSITSNIAEGFSRKSNKEKMQFYHNSLGSLTELQNQLLIAKDISYLTKGQFENLAKKTVEVHKLLNGLIKACKTNILDT